MEKRHILLSGDKGVGKSTLIRKLLLRSTQPVYGFVTRRMDADETGLHPVYIHPAGAAKHGCTPQNLVGACNADIQEIRVDVFNELGVQYIAQARPGGIIVMDELGFLEAKATVFTERVLSALDGDIPVIAAVKARYDVPFLNRVRACKKAALYHIDVENRDALYETLLPIVLSWNA